MNKLFSQKTFSDAKYLSCQTQRHLHGYKNYLLLAQSNSFAEVLNIF